MILYMYIALGQGLTTPWGQNLMSTVASCHFGHLLQVSKTNKKISLKSDFILFFHDFIIVYSPGAGAGADSPQGTKF